MEDLNSVPVPDIEEPKAEPQEPTPEPSSTPSEPSTPNLGEEISQLKEEMGSIAAAIGELRDSVAPAKTEPKEEGKEPPKSWEEWETRQREIAQEEWDKKEAAKREEAENATKEKETVTKQVDEYIDGQLGTLEQSGFLPKIVDATNESDAGRMARAELFGYATYLGTPNLVATADAIKVLHDAGRRFDPKVNKIIESNRQPEGINAPVGSSSNSTPVKPGMTPEAVANARSLDDIDPNNF